MEGQFQKTEKEPSMPPNLTFNFRNWPVIKDVFHII